VTTIYKTELIKHIARQARVSQPVARRTLNAALATIQERLAAGDTVSLPGFGTFYTRTWPGGRVLDFPSGEWKQVGPHPTTAFRAGAVTKRLVDARGLKRGRRRGRPGGRTTVRTAATIRGRHLISTDGLKTWLHRPKKGSKSS
jgi:DNA-binding protein HU-beta